MSNNRGDRSKSTLAEISEKEIYFPDKISYSDDPNVCHATGSAAELTFVIGEKKLTLHITDVQFEKLRQNMNTSIEMK